MQLLPCWRGVNRALNPYLIDFRLRRGHKMFHTDKVIEECSSALKETNAHSAVQEIVERTVSDPNNVIKGLGEPKRAGVQTLYRSADLTIINFTWGPRMSLPP